MEAGAKGCEVLVSGKLRAARAKAMKFTDGFMIHSGPPNDAVVDYAVRHVLLRQGVLGIKVKMYVSVAGRSLSRSHKKADNLRMKPFDPEGKMGPSKNLPDAVSLVE